MMKLTDSVIRGWVRAGERFEGRSDGGGLTLRLRSTDQAPRWLFRYRFQGRLRSLHLGSYADVSLAEARRLAKQLRAQVTLGHDVAAEKQQRTASAVAKLDAAKHALTVAQLCDEYMAARIIGHWKHPDIVRSRIERDIKPAIGKLPLADVKPHHIDQLLKAIVKRGAPTMANDVLRWLKRMFDYAVKRELVATNPAAPFDPSDAGGTEASRDRWLTRTELGQLFQAMREAKGWSCEHTLTVKLLLMLGVRKSELMCARLAEFDLAAAVWRLPAERTKTGAAIAIPLPTQAVACLRDLSMLAGASGYLLPAKKQQLRMLPHLDPNSLNAALAKNLRPLLRGLPPFVIHDFRRTARTHLEALGIPPHIAERCLNHKLKGVEGIYNRHDYFNERKAALQRWADLLEALEQGGGNVVALKYKA